MFTQNVVVQKKNIFRILQKNGDLNNTKEPFPGVDWVLRLLQ